MILYFFLLKIMGLLVMVLIIFLMIKLIIFFIRIFIDCIREGAFSFNPWRSGCRFPKYLSQSDFDEIAKRAVHSDRVSVTTNGPIVYGEVVSLTGITTWEFQLSFNDHRRISGAYYISSDNPDSTIPEKIGDIIKSEIKYRRRHKKRFMPTKY